MKPGRKLSARQSWMVAILWVALAAWIMATNLSGVSMISIFLSGVIVFIPIYKSWKQRNNKKQ